MSGSADSTLFSQPGREDGSISSNCCQQDSIRLGSKVAKVTATSGVLLFGLAMLVMCWLWMDPVGIARYGFDAKEFGAETFNFLYTERTQTLNWPTWVLQLILPIFSLTFTLHALANLIEDMGLAPRRSHPGFDVVNADAVN